MGQREVHVYPTLTLQITYNYKDGNYLHINGVSLRPQRGIHPHCPVDRIAAAFQLGACPGIRVPLYPGAATAGSARETRLQQHL